MTTRRHAASFLLAALLGSGCASPPATPPAPATTYRLRISSDGESPRAVLLSLGGLTGEVRVVAQSPLLAQVTASAAPLVLLVGPLDNQDLLEVHTATPGTPPMAALVEASAGATAGYRQIAAAELTLEWVEVP